VKSYIGPVHDAAARASGDGGGSIVSSDGLTRRGKFRVDGEGHMTGAATGASNSDVHFSAHLTTRVAQENVSVDDVLNGLSTSSLDRALFHLNSLTATGRGLDTLKLALGALAVFTLGNTVNLQPWDRDNCKL
jgi:hypothetical protein